MERLRRLAMAPKATRRGAALGLLSSLSLAAMPARAQPARPPAQQAAPGAVAWVTRAVTAPRVTFRTFDSAAAKARVSYHLYAPAASPPVIASLGKTRGARLGSVPNKI